jgi:hypothetical protein
MRKLFFTALFSLATAYVFAQVPFVDSLHVQSQISKVTDLIEHRNRILANYASSLNVHTGFLGYRSRADEQNSNRILVNIVKSDDTIIKRLNGLTGSFNVYVTRQKQISLDKADLGNVYLKLYNRELHLNQLLLTGIAGLTIALLCCIYFLFRTKIPKSEWKKL